MTTFDSMIKATAHLESKFMSFVDDLRREGYDIEPNSDECHTAMVEFMYDAMMHIARTMVDNPRSDNESVEGYINDICEDFWDTEMDGMILDKLEEHFGE